MSINSASKIIRRRPLVEAAIRFVRTRHVVQSLSVGLLVFMPLVGIFRMDIAGHYLVLFGQRLPLVTALIIVPMLTIVPLSIFFVLATKYGRLFCSWACPQGALNEAATKSHMKLLGRRHLWVTRRDKRWPRAARRKAVWWRKQGRDWWLALGQYAVRGLFFPPLAAFSAISYLVAPEQLGGMLLNLQWAEPAVLGFVAICGIFYADLLFLQEKTCRVCFFGYLQSIASYSQRTGVRRNSELKSACHGCSACRDVCFAGVDPRQRAWEWTTRSNDLTFDECVSCGDCLTACDDVTSRRGVPLIMEMPPHVRSMPMPVKMDKG
ncbi:MAG: 4Fe-4S binding protein [Chloroflexota bacterium]